jgi:hypothetical protein
MGKQSVVFNESVDAMLLAMEDEDLEVPVYEYVSTGIDMEHVLPERTGKLEQKCMSVLDGLDIDLGAPMIAHVKRWDDPFDFSAVYLTGEYYISFSYYSAGGSLAGYSIWKFPEGATFDEDGEFPEGMTEVAVGERIEDDDPISLF